MHGYSMFSQALKGKVVIVTGGTGALGREVTKEFLEAGSKLAVHTSWTKKLIF